MTYMLFLIHIETCGYYAVSDYEGIGSNRWVYNGTGNAWVDKPIFFSLSDISIIIIITFIIYY